MDPLTHPLFVGTPPSELPPRGSESPPLSPTQSSPKLRREFKALLRPFPAALFQPLSPPPHLCPVRFVQCWSLGLGVGFLQACPWVQPTGEGVGGQVTNAGCIPPQPGRSQMPSGTNTHIWFCSCRAQVVSPCVVLSVSLKMLKKGLWAG